MLNLGALAEQVRSAANKTERGIQFGNALHTIGYTRVGLIEAMAAATDRSSSWLQGVFAGKAGFPLHELHRQPDEAREMILALLAELCGVVILARPNATPTTQAPPSAALTRHLLEVVAQDAEARGDGVYGRGEATEGRAHIRRAMQALFAHDEYLARVELEGDADLARRAS